MRHGKLGGKILAGLHALYFAPPNPFHEVCRWLFMRHGACISRLTFVVSTITPSRETEQVFLGKLLMLAGSASKHSAE
jgi:hypothetical protein